MNEFSNRLAAIDMERLKDFIRGLKAPCYESTLLKISFPDMDISRADTLTLYQNHFLLFHALYHLQDIFDPDGFYLHIHFMKTMLVPWPDKGKCRFFEENTGRFCNAPCPSDRNYCDFHDKCPEDKDLEELSVKYFYLDKNNFYKLDKETADAFINGAWELLNHYGEYKKSFEILGITETSDLAIIKKAFRRLAKQYHPDLDSRSRERFQEISSAYQLLLYIIPKV